MISLKAYKYYFFLFFAILVIYWPVSTFMFSLKNDALAGYFPAKYFISEALNNNVLPWWNPYINYGYPMHADVTSTFWSPFTWFFSLTTGYSIYTVHLEFLLYCIIGAFGIFNLCIYFKQLEKTAFITALCYVCSGIFVGNAQHTNWISAAALLPFLLLSLFKMTENKGLKNTLRMSIWSSLFIVSAHPYFIICAFYSFVILGIIFFRKTGVPFKKIIPQTALFIFITLLLTGGYIFSVIELMPYLTRGSSLAPAETGNAVSLTSTISFILPFSSITKYGGFGNTDLSMRNMYIGIAGLVFFLLTLFIKKNYYQKVFIATGAFFFLLSFGTFITHFFTLHVPLFGFIRLIAVYRVFAIFFFLIAMSYTLDSFLSGKIPAKKLILIIKVIASLLLIALVFSIIKLSQNKTGLVIPNQPDRQSLKLWLNNIHFEYALFIQAVIQMMILALFFFAIKNKNKGLLFICFADLFAATLLNLPFTAVGQKSVKEIQQLLNVAPKGFPQFPLQAIENNTKPPFPFDKIIGSWDMYNKQPGSGSQQRTYPNLFAANNDYFKSGLNDLYKKTPIAFFAAIIKYYDTSFIISKDDTATCFINKKEVPDLNSKPSISSFDTGSLKLKTISPNHFSFITNCAEPEILVLKQNFYKNWIATVDNEQATIIPCSYTFMSIKVPAGRHEINFNYNPGIVKILGVIALVTLIVIIIYFLFLQATYIKKTTPSSLS